MDAESRGAKSRGAGAVPSLTLLPLLRHPTPTPLHAPTHPHPSTHPLPLTPPHQGLDDLTTGLNSIGAQLSLAARQAVHTIGQYLPDDLNPFLEEYEIDEDTYA